MADCKIRDVYTGIAGNHIRSFNSSGMVAVKDKEVTAADVARVIETAKAVNIPTDQQVLHVLTQEFIVDGQEDIREPIGTECLAIGGQSPHRDWLSERGAKHCQMRQALRLGGAGPDSATPGVEFGVFDAG